MPLVPTFCLVYTQHARKHKRLAAMRLPLLTWGTSLTFVFVASEFQTSAVDLTAVLGMTLERLRLARRGLSQGALAKATGIDRGDIIDYEKGRVWPRAETLARLINGLGISRERFFTTLSDEARGVTDDEAEAVHEDYEQRLGESEITDRDNLDDRRMVRIEIKELSLTIPADRLTVGTGSSHHPARRRNGRQRPG